MFKFLKRIFNSGSQIQIGGNNSTQIQVSGNRDNTIRIGNFNFGNSIRQVNGTTYINGSVVATGGSVVNCNNTISITSSNKKRKKSAISSEAKTFSKVNVNGPFNVTYIKSDKYGVSVLPYRRKDTWKPLKRDCCIWLVQSCTNAKPRA